MAGNRHSRQQPNTHCHKRNRPAGNSPTHTVTRGTGQQATAQHTLSQGEQAQQATAKHTLSQGEQASRQQPNTHRHKGNRPAGNSPTHTVTRGTGQQATAQRTPSQGEQASRQQPNTHRHKGNRHSRSLPLYMVMDRQAGRRMGRAAERDRHNDE